MKICGFCVVDDKNSDFASKTFKNLKDVCDDVFIVLNGASRKLEKLIDFYKFSYWIDGREWGFHQSLIKEEGLLALGKKFAPDWVLALDADEQLCKKLDRKALEELANTEEQSWYFWFEQFWNDYEHVLPSLGNWDVRYFKYSERNGFHYERKPVHCGMAPKWAYQIGFYAPYFIKHYGLMRPEDRLRKVERYKKYDPKAQWCSRDYYLSLEGDYPTEKFNEEEAQTKVVNEIKKIGKRIIPAPIFEKPMKYHKHERITGELKGEIILIGENECWDNIHAGGFEANFKCLGEAKIQQANLPEAPVVKTPAAELQCAICGFTAKNNFGLLAHKRKHNKTQ